MTNLLQHRNTHWICQQRCPRHCHTRQCDPCCDLPRFISVIMIYCVKTVKKINKNFMSTYHSNKLSLISPLMGWCNIRMSYLLCKELWSVSCMKKSNFSAGAEWLLLLLLLGVVCANICINLYNICIYNKHQYSPILYPKCDSITSTIKKKSQS